MFRIMGSFAVLMALGSVGGAIALGGSPLGEDAQADDVATPQAIVSAAYASINRRPGANYDWPRFRSLFLPGALLIPNVQQTGGVFRPLTVGGFIEWIDGTTSIGQADDRGFAEEEITHRIEQYGVIAQVFSTYQKHYWNDDQILGRGINTFQLVRHDGRWWIAGIAWDEESGGVAIPPRYLP